LAKIQPTFDLKTTFSQPYWQSRLCYSCVRLSVVFNVCIVAKRCVLEQKLLLKDARPTGLPAMGSERHGVRVHSGVRGVWPVPSPASAITQWGLLPVNANWPQPDTSHN